MNIAKMMKQAQKMQGDMQRVQEELALRNYEATAASGAIKAVVGGDGELKSLTLSPEIVKEGDAEMLQDLIVTAVREATELSKTEAAKEMGKLTAGLGIPGLG
ncbi:MAG: YbaB/EbfC family nucleoid-associated protein [Blastochloris sp.]|nr:YbaB/EbfC family nucleoid-associated protein [Blastochloris sp.]